VASTIFTETRTSGRSADAAVESLRILLFQGPAHGDAEEADVLADELLEGVPGDLEHLVLPDFERAGFLGRQSSTNSSSTAMWSQRSMMLEEASSPNARQKPVTSDSSCA
jgi:hypothetical protein